MRMMGTQTPGNGKDRRAWGMTVVAVLMIVFGLAEVVTSFTHEFFGLSTTENSLSTVIGAGLGLCYLAGGLLLLTRMRWAATVAIVLLGIDVIGRILMVWTGLYPLDSARQTFGIVTGTAIAALFAVYVGWKWKSFRER